MPLFMDYHKGLSISVEDIKRAHMADEAVQHKYGVVYHQYWVNEQDGTVFCLMEGPDKESCAAVHREAHGDVACSIIEVSSGYYKLFMGEPKVMEHGQVWHADGTPDPGIRNILVIHIQGVNTLSSSLEYQSVRIPLAAKKLALAHIDRFKGREVNRLPGGSLIAVFDSSVRAVECAFKIQKELIQRQTDEENHEWNIAFRIGLNAGQPVTEAGGFFSEATTLARRLCSVASRNQVLMSSKVREFSDTDELTPYLHRNELVKVLTSSDENFIISLFEISEEKLSDEHFTIDTLSRSIGISRPQLYRKTVSLTGKSPNDFIRDLRMNKALSLIQQKAGNISEISLEVGYSNPSYFAKCFQMRYGCTPSRFIAMGNRLSFG
jgi:AraC-like DNA-binding protein/class 3 adenylate cyclase